MRAAVVHSFDHPPRYQEVAEPAASGPHDEVVDVLAAGLHPRVRSGASGAHYTSTGVLPLVPGVDGVGRGADGRLRYFVLDDTPHGSMAERTVIDRRRSIELPDGTDPVLVAAAMNPAMSSWIALRRRISFAPGQQVLVLGATGNAGRLAVEIAKHLGAARVVGAGRNEERLASLHDLGADRTVSLAGPAGTVADEVAAAAAEVDVVLDYLWGEPAATAMAAMVTARGDRSRALAWIQIGAVAGPTAAIASAALRATNLHVLGSGQGSVTPAGIVAELPSLVALVSTGALHVQAQPVPLADVEQVWTQPADRERRVFTPAADDVT